MVEVEENFLAQVVLMGAQVAVPEEEAQQEQVTHHQQVQRKEQEVDQVHQV